MPNALRDLTAANGKAAGYEVVTG